MKKLFLHLLTTSVGFVLVLVPCGIVCIVGEYLRDVIIKIKNRLCSTVQN